MKNSKRIFFIVLAAFFIFLIYISYDISSKTTFPGSKPYLKEKLKKQYLDSIEKAKDTTIQ